MSSEQVGCQSTVLKAGVPRSKDLRGAGSLVQIAGGCIAFAAAVTFGAYAHAGPAVESLPALTLQKLDTQIVLALKKSEGAPPFDQANAPEPDIPIKDGSRVLIDVDATVSEALLRQIALVGGQLAPSPDPTHVVRAMVPLAEVAGLASRDDVLSISPTRLSVTRGVSARPTEKR